VLLLGWSVVGSQLLCPWLWVLLLLLLLDWAEVGSQPLCLWLWQVLLVGRVGVR